MIIDYYAKGSHLQQYTSIHTRCICMLVYCCIWLPFGVIVYYDIMIHETQKHVVGLGLHAEI